MELTMQPHKIVSEQEWLTARKGLLAKEKEFTRARDRLSAERHALPWVKVDKPYVFDTREGEKSLAELFGDKSQLIVYHFMLAPGWKEGCPSCSYLAIILTELPFISPIATWRLLWSRGRHSSRSRPSGSAWAGAFPGCLRAGAISTSTTVCPSVRRSSVPTLSTITKSRKSTATRCRA